MRDLESELAKKRKGNIERVSMKQQIALTFIPFGNLMAAYSVKKLQRFLLYAFLGSFFFLAAFITSNKLSVNPLVFFIVAWLVSSLIMVQFIIKWSSAFNKLDIELKETGEAFLSSWIC
jgi:hypothetical protein